MEFIVIFFSFFAGILFGGLIFFLFNKSLIKNTFENQFNETSKKVIEEIKNREVEKILQLTKVLISSNKIFKKMLKT